MEKFKNYVNDFVETFWQVTKYFIPIVLLMWFIGMILGYIHWYITDPKSWPFW